MTSGAKSNSASSGKSLVALNAKFAEIPLFPATGGSIIGVALAIGT
jgi:hypothetical protein